MDPLQEAVLQLVTGRTALRPIQRDELVAELRRAGHLNDISDDHADRKARDAIAWLRTYDDVGARIVSSSKHGGYFLATRPEQIEEYVNEEQSRIATTARKIKNMRRAADRMRPKVQGRLL